MSNYADMINHVKDKTRVSNANKLISYRSNNRIEIFVGYYITKNKYNCICISENKDDVSYYLQVIRKLTKDNSVIRVMHMSRDVLEQAYGDYILREYNNFILTERDITIIIEEEDEYIKELQSTIGKLEQHRDLFIDSNYRDRYVSLDNVISSLWGDVISDNMRDIIRKSMYKNSWVFTHDITYYRMMMYLRKEEEELDERYLNYCAID